MEIKWRNPITGELFIHKESEGRKELLYDNFNTNGGIHSHAVWNDGKISYLRDINSPFILDDRIK